MIAWLPLRRRRATGSMKLSAAAAASTARRSYSVGELLAAKALAPASNASLADWASARAP